MTTRTMTDAIFRAMLAREFGREMKASLDARQMALANERNAYAWDVCHTHDFCDANMVMEAAFVRLAGRSQFTEGEDGCHMADADLAHWNEAWDIAKSRRFWGDAQEGEFAEWQATREACDDLGAQMDDAGLTGEPGLIYEGGYINEPVGGSHGKRYYLLIERSDWVSDDLEALERILFFEWVLPNAFIIDQRAEDARHG